ncbi:hypothetical protein E9993_14935 [Labilibacter sediminis]|nr:hypothetical protein E9993_14935 [Labilibacter sediminis]
MSLNKLLGYLSIVILVIYFGTGIYIKTVTSDNIMVEKLFDGLYVVLQLLGIAFLLLTTKIKENHKRKLVRLGDLLIVAGAGILILHLPTLAGFALISGGLFVILIDQIIRLKYIKTDLFVERLKIAWYVIFWTGFIFKGLHLPGARILLFTSVIVLWIGISGHLFKSGIPKYINE